MKSKNTSEKHGLRDAKDPYFNFRLRKARLNAGYTLQGLQQETGINYITIYSYEKLRAFPREAHAQKLAQALGEPIGYLFPDRYRDITTDLKEERSRSLSEKINAHVSLDYVHEEHLPIADKSKDYPQTFLMSDIATVIDTLLPRDRDVLRMKWGLNEDQSTYTLNEIGDRLQIPPERVKQIEIAALHKIRKRLYRLFVENV